MWTLNSVNTFKNSYLKICYLQKKCIYLHCKKRNNAINLGGSESFNLFFS